MYQHKDDADPSEVLRYLNLLPRGSKDGVARHNVHVNFFFSIREEPTESFSVKASHTTHYEEYDINKFGRISRETPDIGWHPDIPPEGGLTVSELANCNK